MKVGKRLSTDTMQGAGYRGGCLAVARRKKTASEKKWEAALVKELPYINIKPFSHNIVSLCLQAVAKEAGNKAANALIRKHGLVRLGWREVKES